MIAKHQSLIVIGSGPGGAALAQKVAKTGKSVMLLERGEYLTRSRANWNSRDVFVDGAYQAKETWRDRRGRTFAPGLHYYVGGNSKVYGAALLRFRERDFEAVRHKDGVSPAWPLTYADFEPYYRDAEALFQVHGARGEDPTEPPASSPFPYPPVSHEPRIQDLSDRLIQSGLRPFHLPLGILLDEDHGRLARESVCIRCSAFDGYPCPLDGKADAQVICVDPALAAHENLTLLTDAYVSKLETDATGRRVTCVHVTRRGQEERYSADIVVVACGALSSALLLLRSANDKHPQGLANRSGQVGRNYMRHNQSVFMAVTTKPNETIFQKTLAISDYYFAAEDWDFPLGLIQMCAVSDADQIRGETLPSWLQWLPRAPFEVMARHAMDFWLSSEDLPRPENRVFYDGRQVVLDVTGNNLEAHRRLKRKLKQLLNQADERHVLFNRNLYFGKNVPIGGTAHQAGTARFGVDPMTSVLDPDCRAHDVDNLYLADASFFPSIAAVNPTLTIVANALRVADRISERLAG